MIPRAPADTNDGAASLMSTRPRSVGGRGSLHRRLAMLLAALLLVASAVSALLSYRVAVSAASTAYDRSLLDPALALARYVKVADNSVQLMLPGAVADALRIDSTDHMVYRVTGPDSSLIDGFAGLALPANYARGEGFEFYDIQVGTDPMRVVALYVSTEVGVVTVQVAETLGKRRALVRELILASVLPEGIVVLLAGLILWYVIGRGLAPLDTLRDEIVARTPTDLRPVDDRAVPDEIRPLVASLNELLGRLRGALDSQQQFIGNAAHQLRTPLAALSTYAELALREAPPGTLQQMLKSVQGETERMTHLVNQLLTLARAEMVSIDTAPRPLVDLKALVSNAASGWVRKALDHRIDLGFELGSVWIDGEPLLLRELLGNLLDNAIHYTPAGGNVTVRTVQSGDAALLIVEDDGPGIPAAHRARVLERFYRVPGTIGDGCGLGLAIVRDIAIRHHGTVTLGDGSGGRGTKVEVNFVARPEPR